MKVLLSLLTLFVFLSLLVFSLFLYGSGSRAFAAVSRSVGNGMEMVWSGRTRGEETQGAAAVEFSWKRKGSSQEAKVTPESKVMARAPALERCPETPPGLVGPLHVEFNKQSLEEVVHAVGSPLQEGGHYKPPDCISRQKVHLFKTESH